jgi:hypothetical protein
MCSEPPFLGSIFTVNVSPGRVGNSRRSPSVAARIRGVGLVTDLDCSTGVCRAAAAQQYTIEKTPIADRTDGINASCYSKRVRGMLAPMYARGYCANLLSAMQYRKEE